LKFIDCQGRLISSLVTNPSLPGRHEHTQWSSVRCHVYSWPVRRRGASG